MFMVGRVTKMDDIKQQQVKRQIRRALTDIEEMKQQLAGVRQCCQELAQTMRQIREESEKARENARRRQQMKRII